MNSQDIKNAISGVLVVDKPVGMTSHDVVQAIRNGTHLRRAGHTGTLDPRASGVLVILVGPAVRLSEYVSASDKRYQAIIRLGGRTDTFDAEGKVTPANQPVNVTEAQFEEVLKTFVGEIEQTPPPYSAVKVQGRKAYEMARKGEEVELEPLKITVHHLEVLEWAPPEVVIDVHCSSGTYVRSLANDLGALVLEKLFKPAPPGEALALLARVASSLERLAQLFELQLASQGLTTANDSGEGEVLDSDPDHFLALEAEEERIRVNGLAPGGYYHPLSPDGRGLSPIPTAEPAGDLPPAGAEASLFSPSGLAGSWALPVGPEGAEKADAPPQKSGRA